MLNIVIPLGGNSIFFDSKEYVFPKPLIEVEGLPMIERVINNLNSINIEKRFIFILNSTDCTKYHLDESLKLLTDNQCTIIKLENFTLGAACSALMAIQYINNNEPLIISNGDQIIESNLSEIYNFFHKNEFDSAVITFESVHPRWSFVKVDVENIIIESSEKRPISKNAIAGFYYFKQGADFVNAAMQMIEKDNNVNGQYYIAPCINEMILNNKVNGIYKISKEAYHTFYSPLKIEEYSNHLKNVNNIK